MQCVCWARNALYGPLAAHLLFSLFLLVATVRWILALAAFGPKAPASDSSGIAAGQSGTGGASGS